MVTVFVSSLGWLEVSTGYVTDWSVVVSIGTIAVNTC